MQQPSPLYQPSPLEEAYGTYLLQTVFSIDGSDPATNFRLSGRVLVPFLSGSGLDRLILRNVWETVDPGNVGRLTAVSQFHALLRLTALGQAGALGEALARAYPTGQTPAQAMTACLQQTAHMQNIGFARFEGIQIPSSEELQQLHYQKQQPSVSMPSMSTHQQQIPMGGPQQSITQPASYPQTHMGEFQRPTQQQPQPAGGPPEAPAASGMGSAFPTSPPQLSSIDDAFGGLVEVQDAPLPPLAPAATTEASLADALASDPLGSLSKKPPSTQLPAAEEEDGDDDFGEFASSVPTAPPPAAAAPRTASMEATQDFGVFGTGDAGAAAAAAAAAEAQEEDFGSFGSAPAAPPERGFGGFGVAATAPQLISIDDAFGGLVDVEDAPLPSLPTAEPQKPDEDEFGDFAGTEAAAHSEPTDDAVFEKAADDSFGDFLGTVPAVVAEDVDFGDFAGSATDAATSSPQVVPDDAFGDFGTAPAAEQHADFGAATVGSDWGALDALAGVQDAPLPSLETISGEQSAEQPEEPGETKESASADQVDEFEFGGVVDCTQSTTVPLDEQNSPVPETDAEDTEVAAASASLDSRAEPAGFDAFDALDSAQDAPLPALGSPAMDQETAPTLAGTNLADADDGFGAAEDDGFDNFMGVDTAGAPAKDDAFAAAYHQTGGVDAAIANAQSTSMASAVEGDLAAADTGFDAFDALGGVEDAPLPSLHSLSFDQAMDQQKAEDAPLPNLYSLSFDQALDHAAKQNEDYAGFGDFVGGQTEIQQVGSILKPVDLTSGTEAAASTDTDAEAKALSVAEAETHFGASPFDMLGPVEDKLPASLDEPVDMNRMNTIDSAYYSAQTTSVASSGSEDCVGFEDAAESFDEEGEKPSPGVEAPGSVSAPKPVQASDDDPFSMFDSPAGPPVELPPSTFPGAPDGEAIQSEDKVVLDQGSAEHDDDFGDFEDFQGATSENDIGELSAPDLEEPTTTKDVQTHDDFGGFTAFQAPVSDRQPAGTEPNDVTEDEDFGDFASFQGPVVEEESPKVDSAEPQCDAGSQEDFVVVSAESIPQDAPPQVDDFGGFETGTSGTANDKAPDATVSTPSGEAGDTFQADDSFGDFASFGDFGAVPSEPAEPSPLTGVSETTGKSDGTFDALHGTSSEPSAELSPELVRDKNHIVSLAVQLPGSIRRKVNTADQYLDFDECFDRNVGTNVPVTQERRKRVRGCMKLIELLLFSHIKLASTYWAQCFAIIRDELAAASSVLQEFARMSKVDREYARDSGTLQTYVDGLGEFVRVCRFITATLGDLLMLEPATPLTNETLNSSWGSLSVVNDALTVETLWMGIEELCQTLGLSSGRNLETIVDIRSRCCRRDGSSQLCQFTLQSPPPTGEQQDPHAMVTWEGQFFMAGTANLLANNCPFYRVHG
jgi:hypothetical protein